jgi:hypothetical protein
LHDVRQGGGRHGFWGFEQADGVKAFDDCHTDFFVCAVGAGG